MNKAIQACYLEIIYWFPVTKLVCFENKSKSEKETHTMEQITNPNHISNSKHGNKPGIHHHKMKPTMVFGWMLFGFIIISILATIGVDIFNECQAGMEHFGEYTIPWWDVSLFFGALLVAYGIIAAFTSLTYYQGGINVDTDTHKFRRGLFFFFISRANVLIPLIIGFILLIIPTHLDFRYIIDLWSH